MSLAIVVQSVQTEATVFHASSPFVIFVSSASL
jgi:hypothetical protein